MVQLLLTRDNVDVNTKNNRSHTPLSFAAEYGHEDLVQLLLARDVDVNIKSEDGKTAADYARERNAMT